MRSPLLAGLIGALLLATPALAAPRGSPWSASILGGPATFSTPEDENFDNEFAVRASVSRRITGPWDAGVEAGYTRFGRYYDATGGDGGPPYIASGGEFADSYDLSVSARWHLNIRTIHPYLTIGAGAHSVLAYFPEAEPLEMARQIKPGIHAGMGLHGIVVPSLGVEVRWLTIYDGGGRTPWYLYATDRDAGVLQVLFTLTKE